MYVGAEDSVGNPSARVPALMNLYSSNKGTRVFLEGNPCHEET